ncbi:unnamed protein product [Ranitomeya imitator]|uniref:Gypsy retrotransposon integrase-like protein 1 n=1 Tax=Ranitomeya imitator TaxID=111125 RepID=A0ABN9MBE0_9NEOB|nr:unnamed protein product [Ranitomeya imitator]
MSDPGGAEAAATAADSGALPDSVADAATNPVSPLDATGLAAPISQPDTAAATTAKMPFSMPYLAGAAWLPRYSGESHTLTDFKEGICSLLEFYPLTEPQKVTMSSYIWLVYFLSCFACVSAVFRTYLRAPCFQVSCRVTCGLVPAAVSDMGIGGVGSQLSGPDYGVHACASIRDSIGLSPTNGQTEQTNQTLKQYLRCYICHLQDDWLELLPLAEVSYNNSQNATTMVTPFFAILGYHSSIFPRSPVDVPVPAVEERLTAMRESLEVLKESLTSAQERYKKSADSFPKPAPMIKVGDSVWLSTKNLRLNISSQKLVQKFIGPFKISSIVSSVACSLKLARNMKVHPVFHVSLLKPVSPNKFQGRSVSHPQPVLVDGQEQFLVEEIIDSRIPRNRLQYLIRWQGYPPEEDSWEPMANICAPQEIAQFHLRYPEKPAWVVMAAVSSEFKLEIHEAQSLAPLSLPNNKLFIPVQYWLRVLQEFHESAFSGHPGVTATRRAIARQCWWSSVMIRWSRSNMERALKEVVTVLTAVPKLNTTLEVAVECS